MDLRSTGRGFKSKYYSGEKLRNNFGQVVHKSVNKQYNLVPAKWLDALSWEGNRRTSEKYGSRQPGG